MKKILTLLLVLVLSLSVMVGCDKIPGLDGIQLPSLEDIKLPGIGDLIPDDNTPDTPDTPEHEHNFVDGECECGEKDPNYVPVPEVDADLQSAADFIHMSAKEILKETGANYELPTAASVGTKTYTAEWTVDNELVTFAPHADKENVIVVNIPRVYENVEYTIKFVMKNENGEEVSREYKHIIPAFKVASFEEYMDAKKDDVLTVKGIVAAMCSKGAGAKRNHVYVIDESGVGGYLNYNMVDDPAALGVKVGMTVLINGAISPSNGMQEFYQGTVEIIDETIKEVPVSDITSIFAEGGSLDNYVARLVTIKGVTLGNQDLSTANSQYLYFTLGEEKSYIRTYITDFPSSLEIVVGADGIATSPAKDAIDAFHAAHFGWTADVTGILVYYSGSPYLVPVSIDCFTNLKEVERPASEKIATSIENVTVVDEIKEDTVLELPLVGLYDDVTISWTVNSTAVSFIEDGKLEVKLGETEVTLTLTATFTCGEVSETKEYTILVGAASTQQYITKSTSDVKEGVAYKFGLVQAKLGETLYLTGEVDGRYLVTTKYLDEAVDVYAEAAENGYKFYILVDEAKQYITVYNNADGKLSVKFDAAGTSVYAYNATVNAWVTNMDGTDYYLGTYNDFSTVSASKLTYITAENTGVSQFPANFYTLATAELSAENTSAVKEGVAYKFGLVQAKLGETLYLTGEVDGRYLVTTKYLDEAVDVYAEAAESGYKFYILVDEAKQYITVYNNADGKLSVKFDAAGTSVYAYNATVNAWVTNMDGTDYYLGTYNDFSTVSASKLTYITAENTGVSQFPANFYELTLKETAIVNKSSVEEGVDYKFGLVQAKLGETLYLTGEVDGRYLVTTKYYDEAVNVYVEAAENGYKFYILVDEAKQYITVYNNADGKLSVKFDAAGTSVYAYNATVNAWVTNMDGTDYYLGTYNDFSTVSASKLTYITAENTGVSQFPANFFRYEFVTEEPACNHANTTTTTVDATCTAAGSTTVTCNDCGATVSTTELPKLDHTYVDGECSCGAKDPSLNGAPVETPVAGTAYKFGMVQGNLDNAIYYLAGGMNGYYLETTNDASKALDVYLEETTGGYYLYCYVNGAKTYINMVVSGTHVNGAYEATASTVYTYNTEKKTIVSVVDGSDYWMGTRNDKTYTTVGPVKVEYDGFYCQFYAVDTTETPHEHVYVDGKCECGEEDPNYVPPTVDPDPTESTTVTVVIADYAAANNWADSTLYDAIVIDGNVTVKSTGTAVGSWGQNTGKYYTNGNNWRIYQNENPEVTISGADGVTIISVKITYAVKNTGTLTLNGENIASETVVTVNANSVTFSVGNTGTATNGQAQITAIEVVYSGGTATENPQPPVHEHTFVDGKCACGEEDPNYVPPAGPVEVTIPEALELADDTEIIVKGTVSEINTAWSDQYNNITVTIVDADGNTLYLYRLATKVGVGDVITVTGKMGTHNNSRQVAAGATAVIDVAHVCSQWSDATCTAPKTCVVCGATEGETLDHSYTNGVCSVCGVAEPSSNAVTASKTIAELITSEGWTSSTTKQTFSLDSVVTVKIDGGSNTGKAYEGNHIRIYATDSPAGSMTITLAEGYQLISVKVTTVTGTYAFLCVGDGTEDISNVSTAVSGSSVVLNSVKNGSNGKQVRVLAIEVVYEEV